MTTKKILPLFLFILFSCKKESKVDCSPIKNEIDFIIVDSIGNDLFFDSTAIFNTEDLKMFSVNQTDTNYHKVITMSNSGALYFTIYLLYNEKMIFFKLPDDKIDTLIVEYYSKVEEESCSPKKLYLKHPTYNGKSPKFSGPPKYSQKFIH
ncbi:MAG: hypothetical protein V4622_06705 [Bacteroidota bacterium]